MSVEVCLASCRSTTGLTAAEPVLPDWVTGQLAEIAQFTAEHRLAPNTLVLYEDGRKTWELWAGDLGHDAWPASPQALLDVLTWVCGLVPDDPGPGLSASRVDGVMAAVADLHRTSGWAAPFDDPALADVRRAVRQILLDAKPRIPTPPVTLTELRLLVDRDEPVRNVADAVREVVAILHLVCGVSLGELVTLQYESPSVLVTDSRRVQIACACERGRARLCLSCAAATLPRRGDRVAVPLSLLKRARREVLRIVSAQGSTPWTEPLLAAASRPSLLGHYRQRAWILLMFDKGIRSLDVRRLARADLTRTANRYRVTVRRAAKDPLGETVTLSIPPQADAGVCPVRAIDAWLELRDAQGYGSVDELSYAFAPATGKDGLLRL